MKLLTIAIPTYNSEDNLANCLKSIPLDDLRLDIIIINTDSDKTSKIMKQYQKEYPQIFQVINIENNDLGSAINIALASSKGLYFKLLLSKDLLNTQALKLMLDNIESQISNVFIPDLYITNVVYDKANNKKTKSYSTILPENKIFTWSDIKAFPINKSLCINSIIYCSNLLKQIKLELPANNIYSKQLFVYHPLAYVQKIYYLNTELYHCFIDIKNQNIRNNTLSFPQALSINNLMFEVLDLTKKEHKEVADYLYHHLALLSATTSILASNSKNQTFIKQRDTMYQNWQKTKPRQFQVLQNKRIYKLANHSGAIGRKITDLILQNVRTFL
ncbi:MAG: glycosyltransferase family 2 protein [Erysipelotrichaceae bacterium]